ncbi:MAG TPA: alpha/beta fold hydrolase [Bradyrhizobium sp.]|nr:alpha/beta fold hydrolase [Bradyrhizobium sp.]
MRVVLQVAKFTGVSLVVLFIVGIGAILLYRAYRLHVTAEAIAIHSPTGIDEAMYVKIGGIDQWIQIRGQDRSNPVLLCLHGGPGGTWLPLTALFVPWEKEFTVVQWDQRGAGKTLEATGASVADTMSVDRMAQDGIEVAEFLRTHLHKDKIVLLGHSWGSILGIEMARKRPDLFYAYVGTGQVGDMPRSLQIGYAHALQRARATDDADAVKELESIGAPPFDSLEEVERYFKVLETYEAESDRTAVSSSGLLIFAAPGFSLWDIYNRFRGLSGIPTWRLYKEILAADPSSSGLDFKIPVFFFQGSEDDVTPAPLVADYFEKILAPHKEMVLFEGEGHFVVWSAPAGFLHELVTRVRVRALR